MWCIGVNVDSKGREHFRRPLGLAHFWIRPCRISSQVTQPSCLFLTSASFCLSARSLAELSQTSMSQRIGYIPGLSLHWPPMLLRDTQLSARAHLQTASLHLSFDSSYKASSISYSKRLPSLCTVKASIYGFTVLWQLKDWIYLLIDIPPFLWPYENA